MARNRKPDRGFTLIELMVVVVIIAILAAFIGTAAVRAIVAGKQTRIKVELDNMAAQLEQYKNDFGAYPPQTTVKLKEHLRSKFPRALPGDLNTLPDDLTAAEILWVCLRGWTADPQRPVDFFNPGARRTKTFGFAEGRLRHIRDWNHVAASMTPLGAGWPAITPVCAYTPDLGKGPAETAPYVYYDCSRSGYTLANLWFDTGTEYGAVLPYFTGTANGTNYITAPALFSTAIPANKSKFQLIAPGLDNHYGRYPPIPASQADPNVVPTALTDLKQYPDGIGYGPEDSDNVINFSERNLNDSKP